MSALYDRDILLWSEDQAERLRHIAANDRRNANSPDWANIIEEIEDVGRNQLYAVESHLVQALLQTSRRKHGRYLARCRTGERKREASGTMHARSSRQRWGSGSRSQNFIRGR